MNAVLLLSLRILNESAPALLAGFLLAGLLHVLLLRRQELLRPLQGSGLRPVLLAPLLGAPLPLCSCAVLPTGLTLLRRGARKGTTAAFLLTVPETDVVSILLTLSLMGPVLAVARPVAALATGICTGLAINLVDRRRKGEEPSADPVPPGPAGPKGRWLPQALRYGFVEFFDDLIGQLLIGILAGAVIAVLFARMDLGRIAGHDVLSYAAMLILGVPIYVCASGSTPIAAGLIAAGISPGAALVFLLAGPATNLGSLLVVGRAFGRRILALYLAGIAVVSVLMGVALDAVFRAGWMPAPDPGRLAQPDGTLAGWLATGVLLLLSFWSARRRQAARKAGEWIGKLTGLRLTSRGVMELAGGLVLAWWLAGGICVVKPGERLVLTRFGAICSRPLGPGLYYHWPAPLGGADRIDVGRIRRVEVSVSRPVPLSGTLRGADLASSADATAESWVLTGDENFVDLACVVHYQVRDDPRAVLRALYSVADLDALVQAAARAALQQVVGTERIDSLLTVDRGPVEAAVCGLLQPRLDALDSGLRVLGVRLISTHAPPPVHYDFRDVASAAEDAVQYVNTAREYSERVVREGLADSTEAIQQARGEAAARVGEARGAVANFAALDQEYRRDPDLTGSRLYLEKLEDVLPKVRTYVDLTGKQARGVDLWLRRGPGFEGLPPLGTAPASSDSQEVIR